MIMDRLAHWKRYQWGNSRFETAFRFFETLPPDAPEGRIGLDGDNVFCMIQGYETKPGEEKPFEAHRKYADIQMVLAGAEIILWAPTDSLVVQTPYTDDIEFYAPAPEGASLVLTPGVFCVFHPQDAHAPCLCYRDAATVRKVVAKVRID